MVGYVCQLLVRHANCAQCFSTLWRKAKKKNYRVSVNLLFFRLRSFAKTSCLFWGTLPGLALRVAQIGVSDGTKKMLL